MSEDTSSRLNELARSGDTAALSAFIQVRSLLSFSCIGITSGLRTPSREWTDCCSRKEAWVVDRGVASFFREPQGCDELWRYDAVLFQRFPGMCQAGLAQQITRRVPATHRIASSYSWRQNDDPILCSPSRSFIPSCVSPLFGRLLQLQKVGRWEEVSRFRDKADFCV